MVSFLFQKGLTIYQTYQSHYLQNHYAKIYLLRQKFNNFVFHYVSCDLILTSNGQFYEHKCFKIVILNNYWFVILSLKQPLLSLLFIGFPVATFIENSVLLFWLGFRNPIEMFQAILVSWRLAEKRPKKSCSSVRPSIT